MCGRFAQTQSGAAVAAAFQLSVQPELQPRYNVAPSQPVSVIVQSRRTGDRLHHEKKWGLLPGWSRDPKLAYKLINARSETVAEKPAFRQAFQKRRCLIVADGFYEWQAASKGQDKHKQPYLIQLQTQSLFAFAGLWERWRSPDTDDVVFSCTILTTVANEAMAPIHHRMPVILPPQAYDPWLDSAYYDREQLESLMQPYDSEAMTTMAIGVDVNNPRHDVAAVQTPL